MVAAELRPDSPLLPLVRPGVAAIKNADRALIALDQRGNVLVAESSGRIRQIDPSRVVTTLAGSGKPGSGGDARAAETGRP